MERFSSTIGIDVIGWLGGLSSISLGIKRVYTETDFHMKIYKSFNLKQPEFWYHWLGNGSVKHLTNTLTNIDWVKSSPIG